MSTAEDLRRALVELHDRALRAEAERDALELRGGKVPAELHLRVRSMGKDFRVTHLFPDTEPGRARANWVCDRDDRTAVMAGNGDWIILCSKYPDQGGNA